VKAASRAGIVVVLLACGAGLAWMIWGPAASDRQANNANVVGGIAGVLALVVAVLVLWPRRGTGLWRRCRPSRRPRR
jgi:hypothetical protein